jgi:hypothetical protein
MPQERMTRERERERPSSTHEPDNTEDGTSTNATRGVEQELASGRPASTPFALTGIVALLVWGVAAVVAAILFLVIWLS